MSESFKIPLEGEGDFCGEEGIDLPVLLEEIFSANETDGLIFGEEEGDKMDDEDEEGEEYGIDDATFKCDEEVLSNGEGEGEGEGDDDKDEDKAEDAVDEDGSNPVPLAKESKELAAFGLMDGVIALLLEERFWFAVWSCFCLGKETERGLFVDDGMAFVFSFSLTSSFFSFSGLFDEFLSVVTFFSWSLLGIMLFLLEFEELIRGRVMSLVFGMCANISRVVDFFLW